MTQQTKQTAAVAPVLPPPVYLLGVDLAQSQDYTALVVLEVTFIDTGKVEHGLPSMRWALPSGRVVGGESRTRPVYEHHYACRHLERLPRGAPYPQQVARIKALSDELTRTTGTTPRLVADATGVGRAVLDMLRSAGLSPAAVTITGGDHVSQDGLEYRVPKRDLVSVIQVLLQSQRLKIARALPEADTLTSELLAFKVSISLRGHDSYGNDAGSWREAPNDDLVLACSLAAWYGETQRR